MSRASRRREPSMLYILLHSFGWQRLCWLLGNRFHLASGLLCGRGHFEMVIVSCCSRLLIAVSFLSQLTSCVVEIGIIARAPDWEPVWRSYAL